MAPEVLNGTRYNHKADVWSLGIVFFELVTGFTPFTGTNREDLKRNLEKGTYKLPKKLKLSLQGLDFINCCLQFDPSKRMAWSDLIKHPYITGDPKKENLEEQLHLSYSQMNGHYQIDQNDQKVDESCVMMKMDPYNYLNEKNAILLNCKNPQQYNDVYVKTIEKYYNK
jgi:serine/threonine protein kinase